MILFVDSSDLVCHFWFVLSDSLSAILRIPEAEATLVGPVGATIVIGSAEAIDICSPPGVHAMIHNRGIVYRFGIIVCRVVHVGVVGCVIRVVVRCVIRVVVRCVIRVVVIPTCREPVITIMIPALIIMIPALIIMIPALIIMIKVVIMMSIG
jgi:hypothetical protein